MRIGRDGRLSQPELSLFRGAGPKLDDDPGGIWVWVSTSVKDQPNFASTNLSNRDWCHYTGDLRGAGMWMSRGAPANAALSRRAAARSCERRRDPAIDQGPRGFGGWESAGLTRT